MFNSTSAPPSPTVHTLPDRPTPAARVVVRERVARLESPAPDPDDFPDAPPAGHATGDVPGCTDEASDADARLAERLPALSDVPPTDGDGSPASRRQYLVLRPSDGQPLFFGPDEGPAGCCESRLCDARSLPAAAFARVRAEERERTAEAAAKIVEAGNQCDDARANEVMPAGAIRARPGWTCDQMSRRLALILAPWREAARLREEPAKARAWGGGLLNDATDARNEATGLRLKPENSGRYRREPGAEKDELRRRAEAAEAGLEQVKARRDTLAGRLAAAQEALTG